MTGEVKMTTPEAFGLYSFVTHLKKPEWGVGSIRKSEGDAYHILFPRKDKAEAGDDILARDRDLFRLERACAANNLQLLSKSLPVLLEFHQAYVELFWGEYLGYKRPPGYPRKPINCYGGCSTILDYRHHAECNFCRGMICSTCGVCRCGSKYRLTINQVNLEKAMQGFTEP